MLAVDLSKHLTIKRCSVGCGRNNASKPPNHISTTRSVVSFNRPVGLFDHVKLASSMNDQIMLVIYIRQHSLSGDRTSLRLFKVAHLLVIRYGWEGCVLAKLEGTRRT